MKQCMSVLGFLIVVLVIFVAIPLVYEKSLGARASNEVSIEILNERLKTLEWEVTAHRRNIIALVENVAQLKIRSTYNLTKAEATLESLMKTEDLLRKTSQELSKNTSKVQAQEPPIQLNVSGYKLYEEPAKETVKE